MSAGSVLRILKTEETPVAMQWFAWGGVAVAFSAWALSNSPLSIYPKSEFWLDNPTLTLIKLGSTLMLIAFAWIWTNQETARELELGAAVRIDQSAGLLGTHRTGLRPLVLVCFKGALFAGTGRPWRRSLSLRFC